MTKSKQMSPELLEMIAARFKLLSEPMRLRILMALQCGEKNVSELIEETGLTQSNLSRHLQKLAEAGMLSRRRTGLNVYYAIADSAVFRLCSVVCDGIRDDLNRKGKAISKAARTSS